MRIVFMGTPDLACASLAALAAGRDWSVVGVVTQPDKPKGRDLRLQPPPVKELAARLNFPVLQPKKAREEGFLEQMAGLRPDLVAVAAYGQILPKSLLDLPRYGCVNVHTSLLPKYRGAGPIQWALLNGDAQTGVTIMKMDVGLDTGDILTQETTAILPEDNAQTLHDRLAQMGAELLVRTIPGYVSGAILPRPQPAEGISHAPKIKKTDGLIDWQSPASAVWNRVRGLVPWPGAFSFLEPGAGGAMLKIWRAEISDHQGHPGTVIEADKQGITVACGSGAIRILELQREGGRRLTVQDYLAGHPLPVGARFHIGPR